MATQMDPIKESKETQAGCTPYCSQSTQTESRIEEIKIQQLVEHTTMGEQVSLKTDPDEPDIQLVTKLDEASKIMHSTVHENMLKLLNEEDPPVSVVKEEQFGYDTQSED